MKQTDFNKIKMITGFNFPCISQFDLDMIYQTNDIEFLCKVLEKLNEIIDSQNLIVKDFNKIVDFVNECIEKYTKEQLQEWLNNGTLENLLLKLGKVVRYYDTTVLVKSSTNLTKDMLIQTLGYNEIYDGGKALLFITDSVNDNLFYFETQTPDLYAVLLTTTYVEQFGVFDLGDLNIIAKKNKKVIYLQKNKEYTMSKGVTFNHDFLIYGNNSIINCNEVVENLFEFTGQKTGINDIRINSGKCVKTVISLNYVTDCNFKNIRIDGGQNGIKISRSWTNQFNNILIANTINSCILLDINNNGNEVNLTNFINSNFQKSKYAVINNGTSVTSFNFFGCDFEEINDCVLKGCNKANNNDFILNSCYFENLNNNNNDVYYVFQDCDCHCYDLNFRFNNNTINYLSNKAISVNNIKNRNGKLKISNVFLSGIAQNILGENNLIINNRKYEDFTTNKMAVYESYPSYIVLKNVSNYIRPTQKTFNVLKFWANTHPNFVIDLEMMIQCSDYNYNFGLLHAILMVRGEGDYSLSNNNHIECFGYTEALQSLFNKITFDFSYITNNNGYDITIKATIPENLPIRSLITSYKVFPDLSYQTLAIMKPYQDIE